MYPTLLKTKAEARNYSEPLYFENIESSAKNLTVSQNTEFTHPDIYYSFDNMNWSILEWSNTTYTSLSVPANTKVYLRASTTSWTSDNANKYHRIYIQGQYNIGGNIMSLVYGSSFTGRERTLPNGTYTFGYLFSTYGYSAYLNSAENLLLPASVLTTGCYYALLYGTEVKRAPMEIEATALAPYCFESMFSTCSKLVSTPIFNVSDIQEGCFKGMFKGCSALTIAPELPAMVLANECYREMFYQCSSLVQAPELPATTLAPSCYYRMFYNCSRLIKSPSILPATTLQSGCYSNMFESCYSMIEAPVLPATTLAQSCYSGMFKNCTGLTSAPVLPASTLVHYCYNEMFNGATNLNYVKCTASSKESGSAPTNNWLDSVSAEGTFVKNANYSWDSGVSGIPSGWTQTTSDVQPIPDTRNYFYIEDASGSNNEVTITSLNASKNSFILVSTDRNTWDLYETNPTGIKISVPKNNKIYIKGLIAASSTKITCTGNYNVGGNIASLHNISSFENVTSMSVQQGSMFSQMFKNSTTLKSAENLILPYTSVYNYAFNSMFSGCTGLTSAPALPATVLNQACYQSMFSGCTALTTAPELPATTATSDCYSYMFSGCSNLESVTCLLTKPGTYQMRSWLSGVSATGTLIKNPSASWTTTGESGVPSGWTVIDYSA